MTEISPAILTNDIEDFRKRYAEMLALTQHFSKLHIDFVDGIFLPNKTLMPKDLKLLRTTPVLLIAHFMTVNPQNYFIDARDAGFKWVLFHYEAFNTDDEVRETIAFAEKLSLQPGLVLNPEMPLRRIAKFLPIIGVVQLMGINPGAQGRTFIPETLDKIRELRSLSPSVIICVDGGVRVGIARKCAKAGANILVAGSAILQSEDEAMAIESLKLDVED